MKIKNRIWMCLLTMMLCVGMFSTTAFAYVDESAVEETARNISRSAEIYCFKEVNLNKNEIFL